jgi:5-methylcytosine-specific restriction endonuclease McrA
MGWSYERPPGFRKTIAATLKAERGRCYLCGGQAVDVDHVVPVAQGGGHDRDNLRAICKPCHTTKTKAEQAFGYEAWRARADTNRRPAQRPPGLI